MSNKPDWTPAWAKRAVWYQIFPERFRNGNPGVNPGLADIEGAWPHDQESPWQLHPWTSDWYELAPYERENGHDIFWNLIRRRYGGDLQGIIDKLDYLQDLGITALYLNPVFESPSHHKYDGTVYHHIDRTLGPDPHGDRAIMAAEDPADPATWRWTAADRLALELIRNVHTRGMRIIFDGVFNHVSITNPFFRDVVANQRRSPYADWFSIDSWDDPAAGTTFSYTGWWGVPELPEWRQDDQGIVAGPKEYIHAITRRWMAPDGVPADGIDGWRLDVAFCIGHGFWKEWRALVKEISPEAYLTAEVIDPVEVLAPYLQGDEFDAVMNYNVGFACADYFINREKRITTSQFDRLLRDLREAFDPCVASVQQNLVDSHDSNRVASHIVNPDGIPYRDWSHYHGFSKAQENPAYDTRKPTQAEYDIQKLIALFMMTYVGAPMIYYGDEVGMWGANDPCCRKPMVWDDLAFTPEAARPDGGRRQTPDVVEVNHDLLATYRCLTHLRHAHPALSLGDFRTVLVDDEARIYGFERVHHPGADSGAAATEGARTGERLLVVLNNSERAQEVVMDLSAGSTRDGSVRDLLNGEDVPVEAGRALLRLRPLWGSVLAPAI